MKKAKRGFTITELVIVIAVIAVLAAVLIPTFVNVFGKAQQSVALQETTNAVTAYRVDQPDAAVADGTIFIHSKDGTVTEYVIINNQLCEDTDEVENQVTTKDGEVYTVSEGQSNENADLKYGGNVSIYKGEKAE